MADLPDSSDFRREHEKRTGDRNSRTSERKSHGPYDKKSYGAYDKKHGNSEKKSRGQLSEKKQRNIFDKAASAAYEKCLHDMSEMSLYTGSERISASEKSSRAASETSQNSTSERNLSDASEENQSDEQRFGYSETEKSNEKTGSSVDRSASNDDDDDNLTSDMSEMNPSFGMLENIPDCSPLATYQSLSEMECQMGAFAKSDFEAGDYELSVKSLKCLQSSRPHDTRVLHNIAVAEFYESNCTKVTELYRNLLLVCEKAKIDFDETIIDVDQCVVLFNRAVILYHLHKYGGAIQILDKLLPFVEPLDESLGQKICLLLLELYLTTNQPKKALGIIAYAEAMLLSGSMGKTRKSPEKDETKETDTGNELKLKLIQYKAQCYTMMKTAKPCKREVKALMTSGIKAHHISAFVIKSHLEYQRGNYRKAIKILNSPEWPNDYSKYFQETGDCLQSVYYNNLGCIHYHMNKPSLGAFYVQRCIKELDAEMNKVQVKEAKDDALSHPLYTLNLNVRRKLLYNLGLLNFQREKYEEAFKCFVQVCEYFYDNVKLWLRIAECCIQCYKQGKNSYKHCQVIESIVGTGSSRNLVLKPSNNFSQAKNDSDSEESEPVFGTVPSLDFALRALKNALLLLPKSVASDENTEDISSSTTAQSSAEKDVLQDNPCLSGLPSSMLSKTEAQELRNACLIACSYASLHCGDLIMAHDYAVQLLSQPSVSQGHKYLAHMYAGEALVCMDKFSAAIEHFKPGFVSSISLKLTSHSSDFSPKYPDKSSTATAESKLEGDNDSDLMYRVDEDYYPHSVEAAKLIAQYNLGVMAALRGEWSKSIDCLSELINNKDAPAQTKALMCYIHLCQGSTDVALSYLNQCGSSDIRDEQNSEKHMKNRGLVWTGSERLFSNFKDTTLDV